MARVRQGVIPAVPVPILPVPGSIAHAAEPKPAIVQPPPVTVAQDSAQFRGFLANSVTGIMGITGSGKSSLGVTAVEEAWEVYGAITLWYHSDLGGWGTKLRSVVKHGICRVWYMRNHINPFDTMQYASLGYWPAHILDPENGFAAPDVALIAPRVEQYTIVCPNGHDVLKLTGDKAQAQMSAVHMACPQCGQITTPQNASGITRALIRPSLFKAVINGKSHIVGHRVYDSMTQLNEWGAGELQNKSAKGDLPAAGTGGSLLGSADAIREKDFVFGSGSRAQVGFMQNRTPEWIANIRAIPDQVLPAVMTFGIETSKGDDESGGVQMIGPKIAGNARTSSVPGWLGNCLYAAKEPHNPPETDEHGSVKLYHRLWLTTHVDPRDARSIPIVAKHRGEPLGMPAYLEDDGNPEHAWQTCSLRTFYQLLRAQAEAIEKRDAAKFGATPGLDVDHGDDDVIESGVVGVGGSQPASLPAATGRVRRRGAPAPVVQSAPAPIMDEPLVADLVMPLPAAADPLAPATPADVVDAPVAPAATAPAPAAPPAPSATSAPLPAVVPAASAIPVEHTEATVVTPSAAAPPPVAVSGRVRRTPRPPA